MMTRLAPVLVVFVLAIAAGCDRGNDEVATQPPPATTTSETGRAALERAARSALSENRRLSVYVLWNNTIPAWAERSTRGPALASLRSAAQNRRNRGIRVRMLENRREILSLRLDPSYRGHGNRARSPAREALPAQRSTSRSRRDAERARAVRTPTAGSERSVRRVEGRAPAVGTRSCVLVGIAAVALGFAAPAQSGSPPPPPIQIGISSQQAGPSRATVRARIAFRDNKPGRSERPAARPVSRVVRLPVKGAR